MTKRLIIAGMFLLPFCMGASPDKPMSEPGPGGKEMPPRRVPGEYIVKLEKMDSEGAQSLLENELADLPLKEIKLVSASSNHYKLMFDPDPGLEAIKAALESSPRVISVDPNYLYQKF